ncbi:MAG: putative zinc-binding metallopeptidase [Vicinamibacterales bacterium]
MRTFHCNHCAHQIYFENTVCVSCGRTLAFLEDLRDMASLDSAPDGTWHPAQGAAGGAYRLCRNYEVMHVCNWALPAHDPEALCRACRLTIVVPDVSMPGAHEAWFRLESAKRRLVFTLLSLGLPLSNRHEDPPGGLAFEFKADLDPSGEPVRTGHSAGTITIDIAEADDAERERRRAAVREPYRTLLGHLRHESGHYYWDRLVRGQAETDGFRARFGDEREDYSAALDTYYRYGPPQDWQTRFVSAYASSHAWEDWAETWAHYLHMLDALETAAACGLSLAPPTAGEPALAPLPANLRVDQIPFDRLIAGWFPLTYVVNTLNRGLGLADAYPFVLPPAAVDKLRFVHDLVARVTGR